MKYLLLLSFITLLTFCSEQVENQSNNNLADTTVYKYHNNSDQFGECDDASTNCVTITLKYPEILATVKEEVKDSINKKTIDALLGDKDKGGFKNIKILMSSFIKEYKDIVMEFPDYSLGWYNHIWFEVVNNSKNILTIKNTNNFFTGGAHPNGTIRYLNFDMTDGKIISVNNLFDENNLLSFIKIAESEFRLLKNIPTEKSINSTGYYFVEDKFHINNNFKVSPNGIEFLYNAYEVAPYSMGHTSLFISFNKFDLLLNDSTNKYFK